MGRITGKSIGRERNWGARPGQSRAAELELLLVVTAVCRKSWVAGSLCSTRLPGVCQGARHSKSQIHLSGLPVLNKVAWWKASRYLRAPCSPISLCTGSTWTLEEGSCITEVTILEPQGMVQGTTSRSYAVIKDYWRMWGKQKKLLFGFVLPACLCLINHPQTIGIVSELFPAIPVHGNGLQISTWIRSELVVLTHRLKKQ
ncbi:uncharacterized protein LOC141926870 [Strix aluco]|uniref:uncharacterized protein LOC141926870 n=1 Tax=Strix aluco TaxID=111821 RepID=UPI003DA26989